MKKQGSLFLAVLCLVFCAFCLGFFLGRNYSSSPVQVSVLASPSSESTPETSAETSTAVGATDASAETTAAEESGLVNINTASQSTLMQLPGIGEVLSQRIIDYRTEHGPFQSVTDLLNVNGIGEKRLEAILSLITVGG